MSEQKNLFKNVNDVLESFFLKFQDEQELTPDKTKPRLAGKMLARQIAESTKTKVQESIPKESSR